MATTQFGTMNNRPPTLKAEHFDMDSFFDFNQSTTQPSPSTATTATPRLASQDWSAISPFDKHEERQRFNGPSHDYNLYKQQVGLPVGSLTNVPPQSMYDGYDSGIGEMGFGWGSGIDLDADMNMDFNNTSSSMPPMFFPPPSNNQQESFIDPSSIGGHEESTSNVGRLWPGMHSQQAQQASMQKAAQAQGIQQRQMKLQAQHAQYRQAGNSQQSPAPSQQSNGNSKRASHASEPHVEESISRLLSQMRNGSAQSSNGDDDDADDMHPHMSRMKKDEEDMDEDERLLASEEGKKLSSKERRQLRNKVSARAFRSRRKEYIGQLEGDLAVKAQENTHLRNENQALLQENDRYRTLIETLLRHPAFTPFINDISKDPSVLGPPQHQQPQPQQPSVTPAQQPAQPQQPSTTPMQQQPQQEPKPDFMNFDASQLQIPQQQQQQHQQPQQQSEHVGLAMIPENDFSKMNLNGFQNSMNFNFHSVNAYAVTQVPRGPDPVDLLIESPVRLPPSNATYNSAATAITIFDFATSQPDLTVLLAKLDGAAANLKYMGLGT